MIWNEMIYMYVFNRHFNYNVQNKKMLKIIKKRYILIHMNSFLWNFSDIGCYLWNLPSIRAQNGYSISVLICQSNWCQQGIRRGMHSSFTQFKLVPVLTYGTLLNPNVTHQSTKRMRRVICLPNTWYILQFKLLFT